MDIYFRTRRLISREWHESDLENLIELNTDPKVMEHFPSRMSASECEEMLQRVMAIQERDGFCFPALVEKDTNTFMGFCGLFNVAFETQFTPAVEIGWRLLPRFWGKGFASEGARAWLRYGFENLCLERVVSFAVPQNKNSLAVMERIGMQHCPAFDFDHPRLMDNRRLRRHVTYVITKSEWESQSNQ